jgi:biotin carboxyl carrier protein
VTTPREIALLVDGEAIHLAVTRDGEEWAVRAEAGEHRLRLSLLEPGVFLIVSGGRSHLIHSAAADGRRALHVDGYTLEYEVESGESGQGADRHADTQRAGRGANAEENLTAPMPGTVTQVLVQEGDQVTPGQALVIVEAMKMEHVVRAARGGVVRGLHVHQGEQVEGGAPVAEIGPPGDRPEQRGAATETTSHPPEAGRAPRGRRPKPRGGAGR